MVTHNLTPRPKSRLRPRSRARRCFELSGRYQMQDPTWTLVHGTVRYVVWGDESRYAHGWLKRDGWIYDAVLNESFRADEYVSRFAAEELATFTDKEIADAMHTFGHWGPWVKYDADVLVGTGVPRG
jgi:hypothetical protein